MAAYSFSCNSDWVFRRVGRRKGCIAKRGDAFNHRVSFQWILWGCKGQVHRSLLSTRFGSYVSAIFIPGFRLTYVLQLHQPCDRESTFLVNSVITNPNLV